jgi:3-carboxy-cis,cis-muconate cycloisomerase
VALVRALREAVGPQAAGAVHRGATTQDIVDTAAMLVAARALEPLLADLRAAAGAAAAHARAHRGTPLAGRTLLQQALPTTFGLKAAGWMAGLDAAAARLEAVRRDRLAVQLGGAAGTLAALGDRALDVLGHFARELGLREPVLPWHAERTRVAELAGALGEACGALAKVATDIVLLAQSEVGEARERGDAGHGASSAMAHKRNPVAAVATLACARQAPGLVGNLLASMAGEHERAAGAWHAEWAPLRALLRATGSAAAWGRDALERLDVDAPRMRANLQAGPLAALPEEEQGLGAAEALVDRALRAHAEAA